MTTFSESETERLIEKRIVLHQGPLETCFREDDNEERNFKVHFVLCLEFGCESFSSFASLFSLSRTSLMYREREESIEA